MNSAASLATGLPVGRRVVQTGVLAAYAVPAAAAWAALGLGLSALAPIVIPGLPLTGLSLGLTALAAAVGYGGYFGVLESWGRRGLSPPRRGWQVPQTLLIEAPVWRRVLIWGAILGPGFLTRNPYAGFGFLPIALASMRGTGAGIVLGALIGLGHGGARAMALLRDVRPSPIVPIAAPAGVGSAVAVPTHLDVVLKTMYWRRIDGVALLAAAAAAFAACLSYYY